LAVVGAAVVVGLGLGAVGCGVGAQVEGVSCEGSAAARGPEVVALRVHELPVEVVAVKSEHLRRQVSAKMVALNVKGVLE